MFTKLQSKIEIDAEIDHVNGSLSAKIILLEYGDYECPYSRQAHLIVKDLQKNYGQGLCFVFRNFPLTEIHPQAELAAEAAEAAGIQKKFWEMHNWLFEDQKALKKDDIITYATEIGLNVKQIEKDLDSKAMQLRVQRDFINGLRNGVKGTPTFFINGIRYDGSYLKLDEILDGFLRI